MLDLPALPPCHTFQHPDRLYTADQMHQYARDYAALSQTAGVADGYVAIPKHYAENVGYAAAMLESSESVIDRHNAPALRTLMSMMLAAAPAASGGDTSTNEAWAARAQTKIEALDASALEQALTQQRGASEPVAEVVRREPYLDGTPNPMNTLKWSLRNCEDDLPPGTKLYTTPQPSADAVRELVQRWMIESNWRSGGVGATYKRCADELESLLGRGGK